MMLFRYHSLSSKLVFNYSKANVRLLSSGANYRNSEREDFSYRAGRKSSAAKALVGLGAIGVSFWLFSEKNYADSSSPLLDFSKEIEKYGKPIKGLRTYTINEVSLHNCEEKGIWVSFRHGVYDITTFVKRHPGGDNILVGAGSSVEPFWALYAVHKSPHVLELLEKYRIGNLDESDVSADVKDMSDPYANEPIRHQALKPSNKQPFNAEPPKFLLVDSLITPSELFYVRNHLPVPQVDLKSYELEIEGFGIKGRSLTLTDIKKFPRHKVIAAVQCGGNRRSEMVKVKPVKGLFWGQAAISNAEWTGAKLSDVLKAMGVDGSDEKIKHVQFEGLDLGPTGNCYGASIPIHKALDPRGDVLLAYEMNGEPLSPDHGFPVRVLVPGVVGARHVKWLGRIIVSDEESDSHWQQNDYKGFGPNIDYDNVDFSKSAAIQDTPVTSAICVPSEGDEVKVKNGKVTVKGYAYSGGGHEIYRVDVSSDNGKTWQQAQTLLSDKAQPGRAWGWTLWTAEIPVEEGCKELFLTSKAVDSSYNVQPESFDNIWNLRGVLANAYHRVHIKVKAQK